MMGHMQGEVPETVSKQRGEWDRQQTEQGWLGEGAGLQGHVAPLRFAAPGPFLAPVCMRPCSNLLQGGGLECVLLSVYPLSVCILLPSPDGPVNPQMHTAGLADTGSSPEDFSLKCCYECQGEEEKGQISGRTDVKFEGGKSDVLCLERALWAAFVTSWASSESEVVSDGSLGKELKAERSYLPLKGTLKDKNQTT